MKVLNFNLESKSNLGSIEKNDTVKLIIELDKDYSNSIIRILGRKADNAFVEQIVEATNKIEVILKEQFTSCVGITKIEINIVTDDKEWTSKEFYFYVSNTLNGEIIESKDSIDTLEKVDKFVKAATTELDEFKVIKDDLNSANETMKVDEEVRVTNEIIRENSENIRITSEKERVSNEEEREKNELERVQAESDRKTNENNRRLAETLRNNSETARAAAEIQRENTFIENEDIRNENEKLRIANELKRENADKKHNSNENERKANETTRIEAEKLRVQEEAKRKNNEISREKAEEVRQETYTNFNEAEIIRKADEITRAANEKLRVAAEETRKITFETNETDRSNTFETNEDTRANAFNSSESTRQTSFETNETTRMNKFNEIERAREVIFERNEDARSSNFELKETTRENTFIENEDIRNENETNRTTNENIRKSAEISREKAEAKRVEVEKTRVESETKRVTAETTRTESETARVEAEKLREQRFEEMEGSSQLLEMSQEIKEARTDYFGKEHATLKEKEDREFEFVHIDNSKGMFVESSTVTGHMKIENSIEGKARDSVIKGRTLHNLLPYNLINHNGVKSTRVDLSLIKPNTLYTFIFTVKNVVNSPAGVWCRFNGTPNQAKFVDVKDAPFTEGVHIVKFNTPTSWTNGYIVWFRDGLSNQKIDMSVVVLEGEPNITPEYFEGIKSLGEEENKISILSCGKNLFDVNSIIEKENIIVKKNNGIEILSKLSQRIVIYDKFIPANSTLSCNLTILEQGANTGAALFEFVHTNGAISYLAGTNLGKTPHIFRTDVAFIKLVNWANGKYILDNIQIEAGTTPTSYEPYQQDKKDILLPVSYGAKELPNKVSDESYDNGDYLQKIGRIVLNGTEIWGEGAKANTTRRFYLLKTDKKTGKHKMLCDKLPYVVSEGNADVGISDYDLDGRIYVKLDEVTLGSSTISQWLQANPLTIYYELATPILHKAEVPTNDNFTTFKDVTHISCLNKIAPSNISGKFPVDMAGTISRLTSENKDLINENKILKFKANSLTKENELQQLDIDTNMLATIDLFEMMLGATRSIKGGDSMVEVYVSMIIKGKKKLEDVPAIIRPQVEQMLRDLGVIA